MKTLMLATALMIGVTGAALAQDTPSHEAHHPRKPRPPSRSRRERIAKP